MSAPHPVIGVLRAGALLGLGWVAAAGITWAAFGILWAVLILLVWLALQRLFNGAVQRLGEAIRAEILSRDATRATTEDTPC